MNLLAIVNVKTCESENLVDVLIENGQIARIAPAGTLPPTPQTLDGSGLWLFPGFLDIHIHGAGGGTVLRGSRDDFETMSKTLPRFGTTHFLATTCYDAEGDNHHLELAVDACEKSKSFFGAQPVGLYLEGPFISPKKIGMIPPEFIAQPTEEALDRILDICGPFLKMMTIAPELPGALKLVEKLVDRGIIPAFGHSDATYEQTRDAVAAGVTHATHLFNAMRSIHHRDPGPIPALLQDDRVTVELISDGAHVSPPVAWTLSRTVSPDRLCLITDGLELLGLPDGDFDHKGRTVHACNGSVRYEDGTLVGTTVGQSELMSRFTKFTGWPLENVVRSAAVTPRHVLGLADADTPLLVEGQPADLVLAEFTNNQLTVQKTIIAGQTVYQKD